MPPTARPRFAPEPVIDFGTCEDESVPKLDVPHRVAVTRSASAVVSPESSDSSDAVLSSLLRHGSGVVSAGSMPKFGNQWFSSSCSRSLAADSEPCKQFRHSVPVSRGPIRAAALGRACGECSHIRITTWISTTFVRVRDLAAICKEFRHFR